MALLGMGGIGKTALSVKLAEQLQGEERVFDLAKSPQRPTHPRNAGNVD